MFLFFVFSCCFSSGREEGGANPNSSAASPLCCQGPASKKGTPTCSWNLTKTSALCSGNHDRACPRHCRIQPSCAGGLRARGFQCPRRESHETVDDELPCFLGQLQDGSETDAIQSQNCHSPFGLEHNQKRVQKLLSLPFRRAPRKSVQKRGTWRAEPSHADVNHRWTEHLIGPSLDRRVLFARSEFPPPRNSQKQRTSSIVALGGFIVGSSFAWRPDDDPCCWECCVHLGYVHPHVRSRRLSRRNTRRPLIHFSQQTQRLIGTNMSNNYTIQQKNM